MAGDDDYKKKAAGQWRITKCVCGLASVMMLGLFVLQLSSRSESDATKPPAPAESSTTDHLDLLARDLAAEKAAAARQENALKLPVMDSYKPIVETSRKHDKASKKWSGSAQQKKITDALEKIAGAKEPEFSKRQGDYEPIQSGRTIELADEDKETALNPMWGFSHTPTADAILALGFGYSRREFARFVSTLRLTGFSGDVVLATGPEERMKAGVAEYLRGEGVLAYGFDYQCVKKKKGRRLLMTPSGCQLTNWYAQGDKRGPRPLALARYEMYRSWLMKYLPTVWAIVFDFRDTFFQRNPFDIVDRTPSAPNLLLFAENRQVKTVGNCIFNSGWLRCWGKHVPKTYANRSVVCSGSTMGTRDALFKYTERMIAEFDRMKCHMTPARTESDQGYHNYLYDTGELGKLNNVRVIHHEQGRGGIVNTIGAMNGFRVPKHMKGPLDTFWKIRDNEGYVLEYDGTRSAVVHQWDRFHPELVKFIDMLVSKYDHSKKRATVR